MIKNLFVLLTIFSISQTAFSEVIELDNMNSINCRNQLVANMRGLDPNPVVMVYMKGCSWAEKLRPVYEAVSNQFPHRALFAFDFFNPKDNPANNQLMMRTAMECLGMAPWASPDLIRFNLIADVRPGRSFLVGIDKVGLNNHGAATKEDIIDFIGNWDLSQSKIANVTLLNDFK